MVWRTDQNVGICVCVSVGVRDGDALDEVREGDWPLGIRSDSCWDLNTLEMLAFNTQNHSV